MTKNEFVKNVANAMGVTKKKGEEAVKAVFLVLFDAIKRDDEVTIANFGKFTTRINAAHIGRNPRTGKKVEVEEFKKPVFRPAGALRKALRDEYRPETV